MQILEHSSTRTTTNVSSVTPIEDTNSVQTNAATDTTANAINSAQHLQQQVALANLQLLYYQYYHHICRQISQNIGAGGAAASCWPWALPVGGKNLAWRRPPTVFQLQGLPVPGLQEIQVQRSQAQKIISNAEGLQNRVLNPNLLEAGTVLTTNHQNILPLGPSRGVHAGAQTNSHPLQQYPKYSKSHAVAPATNPTTVSFHDKHSQVTECGIPNNAIAATSTTATSIESTSSNSDLNNPKKMRRDSYNLSNFGDPDKSDSESKQKLPICPVPGCTLRLSGTFQHQAHIRSHTSLMPFYYTFCGKTINRFGDLKRDQRSHTGKKCFQCPECIKKYCRRDHFLRHLKTHRSKTQELQQYSNDSNKGVVVATATNLETESIHNQLSQVTKLDNPSSAIDTTSTATSTKSQSSNNELNDSNKEEVAATATNPETESTPNQHSQVTEFNNPCSAIATTSKTATPTKSLSSNSELNAPRRCTGPICIDPDKSNRESKLKQHTCPVPGCTIRFSIPSQLQAHIRSHTCGKLFHCTFCGKTFNRSGHLNRHRRSHIGEKCFQCPECLKRFCRSDHLSQHLKTHSSKNKTTDITGIGKKCFQCPECIKKYCRRDHFLRHLKTHRSKKEELQQYPNDSNKGEVVTTATNPETESTPNQHSQVTEFDNPSSAIATTSTATSTKSQSLNSELNDSNKEEVVAIATNPETESSPNQHSQVTEFDIPSSAIASTSTATSTKSQSSNNELNDSNKEEVVAIATNPETESTPNQHSQVTEFDNPSSAIATTSTASLTKSQSSNNELNDSNKEEVVAIATNPETESTPNQHSQVTEFDNPSSAIATTSTATSTKSQSSNSELNAPGRRRRCTCAICIVPVKSKRECKQRLYICHFPGCTLMFSRPSNLRTHIRRHIGERPFCCTSCGKTCISSDDLHIHQKIHTDEYIFQCTECMERFSHIYHLSQHLKTHRSKSTSQLPTS